jgi:epoxyqueuosine reductase
MMTSEEKLAAGIQFLSAGGLNLFAVLNCTSLPDSVTEPLRQSKVPLGDFSRLILTAHGGRRFWDALQRFGMKTADPVDHYSITLTRQFVTDYLEDTAVLILYPGQPFTVPLQQLGELAGWSHPSPIGQGINPEFGLWFAYLTAFLTKVQLPVTNYLNTQSPCQTCIDKPCISACPAAAVQVDAFDMMRCADYRIRSQSPCADRCLARMACPVAPQHQYTLTQIQYHYRHSLDTIRLYTGIET